MCEILWLFNCGNFLIFFSVPICLNSKIMDIYWSILLWREKKCIVEIISAFVHSTDFTCLNAEKMFCTNETDNNSYKIYVRKYTKKYEIRNIFALESFFFFILDVAFNMLCNTEMPKFRLYGKQMYSTWEVFWLFVWKTSYFY